MRTVPELLFATALVAVRTAFAVPTVEIKGSKFFTSEGKQFYIKGVVYQGSVNDVNGLTNGKQCKIDADLIATLGANVIRVYSVDPTLDHSECMDAFAEKGIYVMVDMATPLLSINRNSPKWTTELRDQFVKVIDGFQKYDNFLAMFAGNEILNDGSTTRAAPVVKAVIADMKAYRDLMQYRKVPIGYSATDSLELETLQQDYFDCGNETIAADFYGMNKYSWCGDSSMEKSGYDTLYKNAEGYDIPIFLSETGCQTEERTFEDQIAMLGRDMNDRFSGNIIYQWHEGVNKYGLVSYSNEAATGTPSLMGDYSRLKSQWSTLSPAGIQASTYDPTLTKRACPEFTSSTWLVEADAALPTLGVAGFTAPTGPRTSASRGSQTTRNSAATQSGSSGQNTSGNSPDDSSSSKPPIGAIVGGVVGGIVVLGLIIGAIFFFRRKKRRQQELSNDGAGPLHAESDKMVVASEDVPFKPNGYYGPNYAELSGPGMTQELHSKQADPTYELQPDGRNAELPDLVTKYQTHSHTAAPAQGTVDTNQTHTPEPSAHVQAQRKREMEWLESEEARLRQRREQLMQRGREN